MTDINIDTGITLSARHKDGNGSLYSFTFEVDFDAMDAAGLGHASEFSFVYDAATGKAVKLLSSNAPDVLAAQQIPEQYIDEGSFGTERVEEHPEGRSVYVFMSYELDEEESDPDVSDEFSKNFFSIATKVFDAVKAM